MPDLRFYRSWGIYRNRQERIWCEYDPRLLWRPCDVIRAAIKCWSHRRPVKFDEAEQLASRMAERMARGPGYGAVMRAALSAWHHPHEVLWKGRIRGCKCFLPRWETLEEEARREGRQFCLIAKHRDEVRMRLWRRENELFEMRRLANKLARTVRERRKGMRASA